MNNKKIRVGVLLGGRSHEKEISLESGRNIFYKLLSEKYEAIPLFVTTNLHLYKITEHQLVRNSTKEIEIDLVQEVTIAWSNLPQLVDFIFIGLHGGEGENGCVQGMLEMLGIPYNGSSVLTSALCMNKYKTNEFLRAEGFDVPRSIFIDAQRWQTEKVALINQVTSTLLFPCIIKPHDDGCSVLVSKVHNEQEFEQTCNHVFEQKLKTHLLIEEFMTGMELTVGVLGNETIHVLPPSQAIAQQGILSIEEKFLPGAGENQTPAPLPATALTFVKATIEGVYKAVGARGYARIDCFYQDAQQSPTGQQRVIILEINTLPGMTPATCIFHQAAEVGMKPAEFIDAIITLGFQAHERYRVGKHGAPLHETQVMQQIV